MDSERYPILRTRLSPKSIGASEKPGGVGRALLENILPFHGHVFSVNPNRATVLGKKAFPTIRELPVDVELAVIATPAATVPGVVGECAAARVCISIKAMTHGRLR